MQNGSIESFIFKPVVRAANLTAAGTISGTVTDASGAPLAGATVSVGSGGEEIATAVTGADGKYAVIGLDPAVSYDLTADAEGYAAQSSAGVSVVAGNQTDASFALQAD